MSIEAQIRARLASLQPHSVQISDDSAAHAGHAGAAAGGGHYTLAIVADAFAGQSRLARHRLVYAALGNLMQQQIHALALTAQAPNEV
jgi:BolA family transcriptional regulator, general stress-responsive regulator